MDKVLRCGRKSDVANADDVLDYNLKGRAVVAKSYHEAVLRLTESGHDVKYVARMLGIRSSTVRKYLESAADEAAKALPATKAPSSERTSQSHTSVDIAIWDAPVAGRMNVMITMPPDGVAGVVNFLLTYSGRRSDGKA